MQGKHLNLLCFLLLGLGGCSLSLPAAAPTTQQVETRKDPNFEFYLVPVSGPVVRVLSQNPGQSFPGAFHLGNYTPSIALRPGDVVSISVFENGGPSLFGSTGQSPPAPAASSTESAPTAPASNASSSTTLPTQVVESNGRVLVPFVGSVQVAGKSPADAAHTIERLLVGHTVNPSVLVTVVNNGSNTASVGGEVNRAGVVPLSLRGERLLDVIALAGGPKFPAIDTDVRLQRGGQVATVPLHRINSDPHENILVRPKDAIILLRNPKTFTVMGAALRPSQYSFETEKVTVAEAVARAGGSNDAVGNVAGVYLFRYEPSDRARQVLSADRSLVDPAAPPPSSINGYTPIMYKYNLAEADGYFAAQSTLLRNRDLILVTNADGTQLLKLFTLARGVTGAVFDLKRGVTY